MRCAIVAWRMAKTTAAKRTFAAKLEAELAARKLGRRTLARRLSEARGGRQSVDTLRRLLNKYAIGDHVPLAETRHEIEDAIGCERDSLKPDDDEDGSRAVAVVTLDDLLRLRIDELFREREQTETAS